MASAAQPSAKMAAKRNGGSAAFINHAKMKSSEESEMAGENIRRMAMAQSSSAKASA